jgi:hypothetical protein
VHIEQKYQVRIPKYYLANKKGKTCTGIQTKELVNGY